MNPEKGNHAFRCHAMGTTFELLLRAVDRPLAAQLADQAFEELRRLERALSRFVPASDVSRINRLRAGETARIGVTAYECLRVARRVWRDTGGAFDPTVANLPDWPGMKLLEIHEERNAVTAQADDLRLDLGGVGKGYALDVLADLLEQWDAGSGLLHGGESTIRPLGQPPAGGWPVALRDPPGGEEAIGELRLCRRSLSGSGIELHDHHILDPRTGRPSSRPAAWALAEPAALADALSTAFMVMTVEEVEHYCARKRDTGAALANEDGGRPALQCFGDWP